VGIAHLNLCTGHAMKLGKILYITERKDWRNWLSSHHDTEKEIWLVYYKKETGKPSLPYNDAVEAALCRMNPSY
jgi:uncharacterized protein YdeI (YjbR/CyaY-like superfamily)